jgi:Holliday junction DNA helicase RuvA
MIGYLSGKIIGRRDGALIIDVAGVGYQVFVSAYTLGKSSGAEEIALHIHTHVREQEITLYGFASVEELQVFELLISVSGIGPKAGLNILAVADVDAIRTAVANKDTGILTKVSGIGKKTAEKVVLELDGKLGAPQQSAGEAQGSSDAIDALTSMGYSVAEARGALEGAPTDVDLGEKIRFALKNLGK